MDISLVSIVLGTLGGIASIAILFIVISQKGSGLFGGTNIRVQTSNVVPDTPYGGYVFVSIPDEYKSFFHDTIKGFEEFAKIRGYRVSIAIDTTPPGKVGFRFTILDRGVTVSTETVKRDVDEYIARFRETDTLDDMPIIIDPIEHERLKAVISTRFITVKNNAEMYQATANVYKHIINEMRQLTTSGIGYMPYNPMIINQIDQGGSYMAGDSYSANQSPGAAVGKNNRVRIENSTITHCTGQISK